MSKLSLLLSCSALITVAACSSSSSTTPDAKVTPPAIDAAPPTTGVAAEVECASAPTAPEVKTSGFAYSPVNTNVVAGSVVKFTMPADHNVVSAVTGLAVDFNASKCFKFATAGTYSFKCGPHQFVGMITVSSAAD